MVSARIRATLFVLCMTVLTASGASAQVFGTFTWQMLPYCNKVTLTLTSEPAGFRLDGSDDQCGAATKGSAVGTGVFNPDGSVGINFTIVASPSGRGVQVSGIVSPANGQGTWSDSAGNSGTFAFFGAVPGLPVRPLPVVMQPVFVAIPTGTGATTVFDLAGLKLTLACPGGLVALAATTSVNDAAFASQAQENSSAGGVRDSNFDIVDVLNPIQPLFRGQLTLSYARLTGQVVAAVLSVDDSATFGTFQGCEVTGFVTVR